MATIGELIESLKGYGDDPDPIRPEDSDGNGLLEPYHDDIPTSVKEKIGSYLNQRTGGPSADNSLENINRWPVEDGEGASDYSLTDSNGKPVGPTANEYGFTTEFDDALNEAIRVFESEGAFFGGGIDEDNPVDDILDKSGQVDGHDILNRFAGAPFTGEETAATHGSEPPETKTVMGEAHPEAATSSALRNNRWSRGYYPELDTTFGLQNADTPMFQELAGEVKDTRRRYTSERPFVDSAYINKDYSEEMTKASEPWPETDPLLGVFIDEPLSEPWDSIPYSDTAGKVAYITKLMDKMRELNTDHPDWYYVGKQSFVAAFIIKLVLEVIGIALVALAEAITKPKSKKGPDNTVEPSPIPRAGSTPPWDLAYGSKIGRKKNSAAAPPADGGGLLGALLDALPIGDELDFETMMGFLGIPIPYAAMDALSEEPDFWGTFIKTTIDGLGDMIGTDATMVVFWGPIIRHFGVLLTDVDKLWPMPKIGDAGSIIPGAQLLFALDAFLAALRDSSVLRLIRALVSVGDAWFASAGNFSPNNFMAGTDYRGNWDVHPRYRGFRSRTRVPVSPNSSVMKWKIAQSIEELPSLYLLPAQFQSSVQRFGDATGEENATRPTALRGNKLLNTNLFNSMLTEHELLAAGPVDSAIHDKIGVPMGLTEKVNHNRFSPAEVNFMEGLLEAEYMPFYFQDLRTNEIIAFHAFLSSLSDSFSPSYNASSGFGRIEDVQIYQKTSRSISLTFTLAAMQKADMNEMYIKLNKLVTMVYPQWSRGTALTAEMEDLTPSFIQPFSQIPTASPLCRLRVGDIIQSNYSKFNLSRLFGTSWDGSDPNNPGAFGTGDNPDGAHKTAAVKVAYEHCAQLPVADDQGTIDTGESVGFPIGSKVYVVCPNIGSNIGSGNLLSQRFSAVIKSYEPHPRFANDGDTSGANDVFVNVESDSDIRYTMVEGENGWIENRKYPKHKDAQVLYSHLCIEGAFGRSVCNATTWPLVLGKNTTVEDHIKAYDDSGDNSTDGDPAKIAKALFAKDNPFFQSFESSMGRGLAGVITSLDVGYKLNEAPWEIDPGSRGPTMLEISIGFTPIHDIPPGLDSDGYNRAPVYKMASSGEIAGDAWDGGAENGYKSRSEQEEINETSLLASDVAEDSRES